MPLILAGVDVVAMARTGSGKTAPFLVPMIRMLRNHVTGGGPRALVPRPQGISLSKTSRSPRRSAGSSTFALAYRLVEISMENQFEELSLNPDIITATPGRLMHHLAEIEGMSLRTVEYVVFDEADCLFDMGFAEQLNKILSELSDTRQTLLFSATLPSALAEFAKGWST